MSDIINKLQITQMLLESDDDYEPYGYGDITEAPENILQSIPAKNEESNKSQYDINQS